MTWEEAEALEPGCSAEWDVTISRLAKGDWRVERILISLSDYIRGRPCLLVRVESSVLEFVTGSGYLSTTGRFVFSSRGWWLA